MSSMGVSAASSASRVSDAIATLARAAENPQAYVMDWKARHDGRVAIGAFAMNVPAELIAAAGGLPVVVQESREPITAGRNLLAEFYCGYTRSIADQAATGQFEVFDGFLLADQCIQLQGAVDAVQTKMPGTRVRMGQFIASMDETWTRGQVQEQMSSLAESVAELTETPVTPDALSQTICVFNRNRALLRKVYDLRREGRTQITATQLQVLVKSSMVMDKSEHNAILEDLVPELASEPGAHRKVRLHLSGHFCHAPRTELLDLIEACGAVVVDDDLYTGFRYISTDMSESGDPFVALTDWYLERNVNVPCPTRAQRNVDWDAYLLDAVQRHHAAAVIVLMAKFCEPHMLYYPELRRALDARSIPHLLIETEHEGLPVESIRTRVETLLERIRRDHRLVSAPA